MKNNTKTNEEPWNIVMDGKGYIESIEISIVKDEKLIPWFINHYNNKGEFLYSKNLKENEER